MRTVWEGRMSIEKRGRGRRAEWLFNRRDFDVVELVEALKEEPDQDMADIAVMTIVGILEEKKLQLLALWSEWEAQRDGGS